MALTSLSTLSLLFLFPPLPPPLPRPLGRPPLPFPRSPGVPAVVVGVAALATIGDPSLGLRPSTAPFPPLLLRPPRPPRFVTPLLADTGTGNALLIVIVFMSAARASASLSAGVPFELAAALARARAINSAVAAEKGGMLLGVGVFRPLLVDCGAATIGGNVGGVAATGVGCAGAAAVSGAAEPATAPLVSVGAVASVSMVGSIMYICYATAMGGQLEW